MSKSDVFFIRKSDGYGVAPASRISHRIDGTHTTLPELLEAFEDFLKACGYHFNGHVTIEEHEE